MPISRTWWNNLVDDDGSGNVGTIWNKATIAGLLDAIDAMGEVNKPWTPTLLFGGSSAGITYSTRTGKYSRWDEIVVLEAVIALTSKGSAAGGVTITGLPYAAQLNAVGVLDPAAGFAALPGQPIVTVISSTIYPLVVAAGSGSRVQMTDAQFLNTANFQFTVAYRKV
jgi:hypothetical protein